ncbi:hypothetical protein MSAN_00495100 [Mycena sanguinolenta]|uniref:Uncharacterized protein n=1 Tax=Mycena sanguinolenta TaxID=230812 RepID=A0A8H6Z931_9AGAR|nr:hypothetical protein MSAN_00495100 [Mycena sanguinolenta]
MLYEFGTRHFSAGIDRLEEEFILGLNATPSDDELSGQPSHSYSDDDSYTLDAVPELERRYGFIGLGPPPHLQSNTPRPNAPERMQYTFEHTPAHRIGPTSSQYNDNAGVTSFNNRYRSDTLPRRAATQPVRSTIIHEDVVYSRDTGERSRGPQLEHLVEQLVIQQRDFARQQDRNHRELQQENNLVQARLTAIKLGQTRAASARRPARGLKATRGITTRGKAPAKRDQRQTIPAPVVADTRAAPGVGSDSDSADGEDGDGQARRIIQPAMCRGTTGQTPDIPHTNDATGEIYLTPFFDFDVTYAKNDKIFRAVAKKVEGQLESSLPPSLESSDIPNFGTLVAMAKISFRGFKKSRKRTVDADAARRAEVNARTLRHFRRRETKLAHIKSQIVTYAADRDINATVLEDMLTEQHLSDEFSGPEDGEETFDAWKIRMAVKFGIPDLSTANLKNLHFLEVLECPWRSEMYSNMLHDMLSMWDASLTTKERANIRYLRVRGTHRLSIGVPTLAPYDFGISLDWLKQHQDDPLDGRLLNDWNTHGNPDGFDAWKLDRYRNATEGPAVEEGVDGTLAVQEGTQ